MQCRGLRAWALRAGAALTIACGLIGASSHARAQQSGTTYRLEIVGCEIPTLESAVSLELGAALAPDGDRSIRIECIGESARIVVEDTLFALRIERELEPQTLEPHLRARVLALVVTQLVTSLERLMTDGPAEMEPGTPATGPVATQAAVPSEADVVAADTPPVAPAAQRSPLELSFLAGMRVYPIDSATVLTTVAIDLRFDWIALGVEGGGTQVPNRLARVDLAMVAGNVGVVPLRLSDGLLDAGAGIFVEAGAIFGSTVSNVAGYEGQSSTGLLLGASARGWMSLALDPRLSFRASVDVGYDYGLQVVVLGYPTASTDSLMIAVRLGLSLWP